MALAFNRQWDALAQQELQALLTKKKLTAGPDAATLECQIDVTYGDRGMRYLFRGAGFGGKGASHMKVTLTLKQSDVIRYATTAETDLVINAYTDDMEEVARKTIRRAIAEFGARL